MHIDVMNRNASTVGNGPVVSRYQDPLDHDAVDDGTVVTTKRSLLRLALVAAETASRFVREQLDADPMSWMLAPRRLFDGQAAIDACLERDNCLRAILLHGLALGLDADAVEIDVLAAEDVEDHWEGDERGAAAPVSSDECGSHSPRLWTSFLVVRNEAGAVQAFDAFIADDRFEAEARLRERHGARLADDIEMTEGFDPSLPLAEALISPALADMLKQVAADPASPLAEGLSVSVLQRFAA